MSTTWLAWKTKDVADATNQEILADWRPVLLLRRVRENGEPGCVLDVTNVYVTVTNVGRGPALDVRATIVDDHARELSAGDPTALGPNETVTFQWGRTRGHDFEFDFDGGVIFTRDDFVVEGRVTYADIADEGQVTAFALQPAEPGLRWQRVYRNPDYVSPVVG